MKWIKVRDGYHKYVSDDHPAPEDAPPDKPFGALAVITKPPWAQHESAAHSPDTKTQLNGTEAFLADRARWTQSGKWGAWEKDRKQELAKNKPLWRKERMKEDPTL